jgi:outer membrane protein assembly factor BamB
MKATLALIVAFLTTSFVAAADSKLSWPQFRGPNNSGIADDETPPVEIGPEKNIKWKVPAPSGVSSPIVVDNMLVITAFDDGKLYTIAYDRADGKELWSADAHAQEIENYYKADGSPAASSPVTDGERIIAYFGSCGLRAYDLAGKELWKYDLPKAETVGGFGSGVSPIIADSLVILVRDVVNGPMIVALDAHTGDVKWEKKRKSVCSYSTPVVWKTDAGKQVATPGTDRLTGYDLRTGDERWHVDGMPSGCCTSPVTSEGNLFFAGWSPGDPEEADSNQMPAYDDIVKENDLDKDGVLSKEESLKTSMKDFFESSDMNKDGKFTRNEYDEVQKFMRATVNSAFALKPGGMGDVSKTHVVWKHKKGLPYIATAIVYKDQYLMVKDGGILTAFNTETGDELFQKRVIASGSYYASPVAANGNIYFASKDDGVVTVTKAGTSPPEVVVENPPLGEKLLATPAIADDTLYIRTADHLWAFAEK